MSKLSLNDLRILLPTKQELADIAKEFFALVDSGELQNILPSLGIDLSSKNGDPDDKRFTSRSNDKEIIFEFEVPGVKKNQIEVNVNDGLLQISAVDRFGNKMSRNINVNKDRFNLSNSMAKVEDGLLTITIPKRTQESVKIKVE